MNRPMFIGDELSAAGFRAAGLRVESDPSRFGDALASAPFVIITTEAAALVPGGVDAAVRRGRPPVAVIGDVGGIAPTLDVDARVRRVLGVSREPG